MARPDSSPRNRFERGGFWRRALALLIDALLAAVILELLAFALFPLSQGRLQATGGLTFLSCDTLATAPEGVAIPADLAAEPVRDCRSGLFGLTSARMIKVSKATRNGALVTTREFNSLIDADGHPVTGPNLDLAWLPLLVVLRWLFDCVGGTPGRWLCRIRLRDGADGHVAPPLQRVAGRYAAQALALAPLLVWSVLQPLLAGALPLDSPLMSLGLASAVALTVVAVAIAVHAMIYRRTAWYDSLAGAGVLRVDLDAVAIPRSTAGPTPEANYFARHWRGELSLPQSYWLNGLLGGLAVAGVTGVLGSTIGHQDDAQPMLWLVSLILIWSIVALSTGWQVVGIWRAATHYQQSGKTFWGAAAKLVSVLGALNAGYGFVFFGAAQMLGMYEIINGDSRVGPHQFQVMANGQMLDFSGGITFGVSRELDQFINAMSSLKTVRLNSNGGRIREAQKMSDLLRARGLSTLVTQNCLSACTIVFLGGKERLVAPSGRLGFHQPAFAGMTAADRRAAIATEEERLLRLGLSKSFAERANAASPDGMWYPDSAELLRENVVTQVITPPMAPASPPATNAEPVATVAITRPPPTPAPVGAPLAPPVPSALLHSEQGANQAGRVNIPADPMNRLSAPQKATVLPAPAGAGKAAGTGGQK